MTLKEILTSKLFWISLLKISLIFFLVLSLVALLFNSASAIFSGDWNTVVEQNFSEGKWQIFVGTKLLFSFLYGMWVVVKKMA